MYLGNLTTDFHRVCASSGTMPTTPLAALVHHALEDTRLVWEEFV